MLYNSSLMNAVILIGGRGTRLRPFTCDTPKPLLPVLNRPFLHYQFDVLKKHGVRRAILCTSYKPKVFHTLLGTGRSHGLKLEYVHEAAPLGTGGALRNALDRLDGTTLVLNGDVLNKLDVTAFSAMHRKNRAHVSLALTRVKDPTLYGVVETAADGSVRKFVEKPSWDEVETNTVNAGAYIFERDVIARIPPNTIYSLERSLFPQLLLEGKRVFGWVSTGYWIDIGTVEKYLQVHLDLIKHGKPLRGKGSVVHPLAHVGARVCLGEKVRVGKGARLEDCVVLDGAVIGDGARLEGCVVGPGCRVGAGAVLGRNVALAGGSRVGAFSQL